MACPHTPALNTQGGGMAGHRSLTHPPPLPSGAGVGGDRDPPCFQPDAGWPWGKEGEVPHWGRASHAWGELCMPKTGLGWSADRQASKLDRGSSLRAA